jgi:hypothetical protein
MEGMVLWYSHRYRRSKADLPDSTSPIVKIFRRMVAEKLLRGRGIFRFCLTYLFWRDVVGVFFLSFLSTLAAQKASDGRRRLRTVPKDAGQPPLALTQTMESRLEM